MLIHQLACVASILESRGFRAHPEAKLVDLLTLSFPKVAEVKIQQHFPKQIVLLKSFHLNCHIHQRISFPQQLELLLVFSVTPFKIYQNKNQNRPIDKVQNLGNERRYIYKDPRQDSGQRNISYTRYPKKCFTQIYRDLYGDAMLVLTWMSSNMADGNQQKHLLPSFATKA